MPIFSRKININYGALSMGLILSLNWGGLYADSQNSSQNSSQNIQESIHDQRLAQEANALINPSPMQTVSALPAAQTNTANTANTANSGISMSSSGGSNAQKISAAPGSKVLPVTQAQVIKETGVMGYYDSLINNCQKGVFDFDNPAYIGTGKKVSMTASVEGFQAGYCVVNIFFSNQTSSINCLFSNKDLLILKDPKARTAFNNAYAQGELDSNKKTAYDQIIANVCQMN